MRDVLTRKLEVEELKEEIAKRREQAPKIRERIERYFQSEYGIRDFFGQTERLFQGTGKFGICLPRQVLTANLEHAAIDLLVDWLNAVAPDLGAKAVPMSMIHDSYSAKNSYKRSLVQIPWLNRRTRGEKAGELFSQTSYVLAKGQRKKAEGMFLSSLKTEDNMPLPDYHHDLIKRAGIFNGNSCWVDASDIFVHFFRQCIESGGKLPNQAYAEQGGREVIVHPELHSRGRLRPPAIWFYTFHLSFFLDGCRALIYGEDDSQVFNRQTRERIEEIEKVAGVPPLIINTPKGVEAEGYESRLLEINTYMMKPGWKNQVSPPPSSASISDAVAHLERECLSLR